MKLALYIAACFFGGWLCSIIAVAISNKYSLTFQQSLMLTVLLCIGCWLIIRMIWVKLKKS